MTGWVSHDLGDVSLLFEDGVYAVDESSSDPEPRILDEYTPLRDTDGARMSFAAEAEWVMRLNVFCMGTTYEDAKQARIALEAPLIEARNSGDTPTVEYSYQKDASESEAETYFVVGGRLKPVTEFPGSGKVYGLGNRPVALATLTLALSKA